MQRVVQRLLAHPIARQQKNLPRLVIQCNGKHAAQFLHAVRSHFLVEVKNDLGVRMGIEAVAAAFELPAQLRKVIDFTVENDPEALVFVVNGLLAARNVNDTESAHSQAGWAVRVDAFIVRTTVNDSLAHSADLGRIDRLACAPHHSRYATHC